MKRIALRRSALVAAVLGAALALSACGKDERLTKAGPAPTGAKAIPALRREANQLLDGGTSAFRARLQGLRGHPLVVNQWASWCGPCRYEFPFFASLARRYQGRVAFLGVNSQDNDAAAKRFLRGNPVPYPHFSDPEGDIARLFRGGRAFPTTAYYARSGKLAYTHVGTYASKAKLDEDVRKYALGG